MAPTRPLPGRGLEPGVGVPRPTTGYYGETTPSNDAKSPRITREEPGVEHGVERPESSACSSREEQAEDSGRSTPCSTPGSSRVMRGDLASLDGVVSP